MNISKFTFIILVILKINYCNPAEQENPSAIAARSILEDFDNKYRLVPIQRKKNIKYNAKALTRQKEDNNKTYTLFKEIFGYLIYTNQGVNKYQQVPQECYCIKDKIIVALQIARLFLEEKVYKYSENENIYYYALLYLDIAYNQELLPEIKYQAAFYLGKIYCFTKSSRFAMNYEKAKQHFTEIVTHSADQTLKAKAQNNLEFIANEKTPALVFNNPNTDLIDEDLFKTMTLYNGTDYVKTNIDITRNNYIKIFNKTSIKKWKLEAAYNLAHIYYYGFGVDIDSNEAEKYFLVCFKQKNIIAKYKIKTLSHYNPNIIIDEYKIVAAYYLGLICYRKIHLNNKIETIYYFELAYDQNINPVIKYLAAFNLGRILYFNFKRTNSKDILMKSENYFRKVIRYSSNIELKEHAQYYLDLINNLKSK